ncbi:MAG: hypothetical protein V7676_05140 [Parasphingorhabdus sp.]|uniref:hypothetical protein n=1 Tax=Parasphingorhabdus sp. TaxID=2709688 RepID=UPI0030011791
MLFLEALARTGNVRAAALYAGLSRESAYKLRRRADARAFARAWDAAIIHARERFQDELFDRGLSGWTEPVWHQGEEVGTRERWSAPLFLAALARLDRMAEGGGLAGNPARAAAKHFDELIENIGEGRDCTDLLEEIEATAEPYYEDRRSGGGVSNAKSHGNPPRRSDAELLEAWANRNEYMRISAMAPEDIDVSDLDPAESDSWGDMDWERASRSGLLRRSGMLDAADAEMEADFQAWQKGQGL